MKVKTNLKAGQPLGDAAAEVIHATGLDKLAAGYTRLTGRDCGCKARQAWLNQWFPG